jgi:hypothetical protein
MKGKSGKIFIFSSILAFLLAMFFSQCMDKDKTKADIRGTAYADPSTCIKCHKEVYTNYNQTGHYHASQPVAANHLQAGIAATDNQFVFNDSVKIKVEKRKGGLYQVAYFKGNKVRDERFDIAFGSGEKAQTYAYWRGNKIYQLPLTYSTAAHNWVNSPGYPANLVYYNRLVVGRCFECHASFADRKFVATGGLTVDQEFDKNAMVYGIDCQRCHGPAANHVNYHTENPEDKQAKFIKPYKSLTRQQKLDMCGVCHSGSDLKAERSTFNFHPGDTLMNFFDPAFGAVNHDPDVHGNQTKLLAMSKCFASSAIMTCTTCHNSHEKETGNLVGYSQKCMTCHKPEDHNFCRIAPRLGGALNTKCIDCHMPALPSKVISFKMTDAKETSPYLLRTHRIAIYPEQTAEVLQMLKNTRKKL